MCCQKVRELLEIEHDYNKRLREIMPQQYATDATPKDDLHRAWRNAAVAAHAQHQAIYALLQKLSTRAPGLQDELDHVGQRKAIG